MKIDKEDLIFKVNDNIYFISKVDRISKNYIIYNGERYYTDDTNIDEIQKKCLNYEVYKLSMKEKELENLLNEKIDNILDLKINKIVEELNTSVENNISTIEKTSRDLVDLQILIKNVLLDKSNSIEEFINTNKKEAQHVIDNLIKDINLKYKGLDEIEKITNTLKYQSDIINEVLKI